MKKGASIIGKKMKNNAPRILRAINRYLILFLAVAVLVTCTTSLFVSVLTTTLGISLTSEQVTAAAKITFANVIFLSLLITVIDTLRRRFTVDRITSHIAEAAERLVEGDFSVRVQKPTFASMSEDMSSVIDSFNKMAEELAGVETLRGDFISSVSHEMKTPLAVISNYATLLSSPELSKEKRLEYADIIKRSTKRMSDMMTNILKLNRLENQQIYPKAERFDLGESLSECFLSYESVWEKKGIEIETHIEDEIFVEADEELLSLVWNNLFSNAFKFTKEGGKVTLILTANESSAIVRVADTGCGMSSEVGSRIFDKFYQGDSSRATEGNGLGLALVKKVIDIMQGEIYVESELGRGSIFTVVFKRFKENKTNKNN